MSTPEINVSSNVKEATRWLDDVQRKQIPFATSQALNDTAFDIRTTLIEQTFPRAFTLRNRRFPSAVLRVAKSTKAKLVARVYDALGRDYLETHATGGTKRAREGHSIAVPSPNLKRTASGKVPKAKRPRELLNTPRGVLIREGAKGVILRRAAKRRAEVLYFLTAYARIPKRLRFYEDANSVAQRVFVRHFVRRLTAALRTAR